jgi:hypothetical protein
MRIFFGWRSQWRKPIPWRYYGDVKGCVGQEEIQYLKSSKEIKSKDANRCLWDMSVLLE